MGRELREKARIDFCFDLESCSFALIRGGIAWLLIRVYPR